MLPRNYLDKEGTKIEIQLVEHYNLLSFLSHFMLGLHVPSLGLLNIFSVVYVLLMHFEGWQRLIFNI